MSSTISDVSADHDGAKKQKLTTGSEEQPLRSKKLTLDELTKRNGLTDVCIDQKISNEDICRIAVFFENVDSLLDKLELRPGQQTDVKDLASRCDTEEGVKKTLKLWRQRHPYNATFRTLLDILLDLERGDVAIDICCYLAEKKGEVIPY